MRCMMLHWIVCGPAVRWGGPPASGRIAAMRSMPVWTMADPVVMTPVLKFMDAFGDAMVWTQPPAGTNVPMKALERRRTSSTLISIVPVTRCVGTGLVVTEPVYKN